MEVKSEYISVDETAHRAGVARKTIYNWICSGQLTREHGLGHAGRRRIINWPVFEAKFLNGVESGKASQR
jgi:predicted DNA-binding transcriptional regulator AlpA